MAQFRERHHETWTASKEADRQPEPSRPFPEKERALSQKAEALHEKAICTEKTVREKEALEKQEDRMSALREWLLQEDFFGLDIKVSDVDPEYLVESLRSLEQDLSQSHSQTFHLDEQSAQGKIEPQTIKQYLEGEIKREAEQVQRIKSLTLFVKNQNYFGYGEANAQVIIEVLFSIENRLSQQNYQPVKIDELPEVQIQDILKEHENVFHEFIKAGKEKNFEKKFLTYLAETPGQDAQKVSAALHRIITEYEESPQLESDLAETLAIARNWQSLLQEQALPPQIRNRIAGDFQQAAAPFSRAAFEGIVIANVLNQNPQNPLTEEQKQDIAEKYHIPYPLTTASQIQNALDHGAENIRAGGTTITPNQHNPKLMNIKVAQRLPDGEDLHVSLPKGIDTKSMRERLNLCVVYKVAEQYGLHRILFPGLDLKGHPNLAEIRPHHIAQHEKIRLSLLAGTYPEGELLSQANIDRYEDAFYMLRQDPSDRDTEHAREELAALGLVDEKTLEVKEPQFSETLGFIRKNLHLPKHAGYEALQRRFG